MVKTIGPRLYQIRIHQKQADSLPLNDRNFLNNSAPETENSLGAIDERSTESEKLDSD